MTTNDLPHAIAFARSDVHEGDPAVMLSQAKAACRTLADEIVQLNAIIREHLHQRRCHDCGGVHWHKDSRVPYVLCPECGSQDTRMVREIQAEAEQP